MRRAHGSTSQPVLRTAALPLGGAMALDQLRCLLAPGADDVLVEHGHGYLADDLAGRPPPAIGF